MIVKFSKRVIAVLLTFVLLFSIVLPANNHIAQATGSEHVTFSLNSPSSIVLGKSKSLTVNMSNSKLFYLYNVGAELVLEPGITYQDCDIEPTRIMNEEVSYLLEIDGVVETVKKTRQILVWDDIRDLAPSENYSFDIALNSEETIAYSYVDNENTTVNGTQYIDFGDNLIGQVRVSASTDAQLLPTDWTNYENFSTLVEPFEVILSGGGEHLKGAGVFGDLTDSNRPYTYKIKIINNTIYQTKIDLNNFIDTEIEIQGFTTVPTNQEYINNNDQQEVFWDDLFLNSNETKTITYDAAIFNRFTTDISDPLDGIDDINEGDIIQDNTSLNNKIVYSGYITDEVYQGNKTIEYTNSPSPIFSNSVAKDIIIGKSVSGIAGANTSKMKYNDEFKYIINILVNGYYDVDNIVVTDIIGDGQTYVDNSATGLVNKYKNLVDTEITETITPTVEPEVSGTRTIKWNISEIDFDDNWSRTLSLNTTVDENYHDIAPIVANDSLINNVNVLGQGKPVYRASDTNPIRQATDASSASIKAGKPSITKAVISGDANSLKIGDEVTFEITYTANLGVKQKDVVIGDILPKGLRLVDVNPIVFGASWPDSSKYFESINADRDIVKWLFNDYLPEDLATMSLQVTAVVEDDSAVTIDKQDQNLAKLSFNNTPGVVDSDRDGVTIKYCGSKLGIAKTADKEDIKGDDEVTFTLTVQNSGNVSAFVVLVTDTLPDELVSIDKLGDTSISIVGNQISFTIAELAVGASVEKTYKATVASDIGTSLEIENLAKIESYKKISGGNLYTDQQKQSKVSMNTESPIINKTLYDSENSPIHTGDWTVYKVAITIPAETTAYNTNFVDVLATGNSIIDVFNDYNSDLNIGTHIDYTGIDTITVDLGDLSNTTSSDKEFNYYVKVTLTDTPENSVNFTYSNKDIGGDSSTISDSINSSRLKIIEFTPPDTLFIDSDDINNFTLKVKNVGENTVYNGKFRVELPSFLESADVLPVYSVIEESGKKYLQWDISDIDTGDTKVLDFNLKLISAETVEVGMTGELKATIVSYTALAGGGKSYTSTENKKVNVSVANPIYELFVIDKNNLESEKEVFLEDEEVILRSKVTLPKGTKITDSAIVIDLSDYIVGGTRTINIPNDYTLDINNQIIFDSTERTVTNSGGYVAGITVNTGELQWAGGTKTLQDTAEVGLVALNITKSAIPLNPVIGEKITYVINVINTGSETLNSINVVDVMNPYINLNETITTLSAGNTKTYTEYYGKVLESDLMGLASRALPNTVNASVVYGSDTLTDNAIATVNLQEKHVIQVEKSVNNEHPSTGDIVAYTIKVTNVSTDTISSVNVTDPMLALNSNVGNISAGVSKTLTGNYTVTEIAGTIINNTVSVVGTYKGNQVKVDGQKSIIVNTHPVVGDYSKQTIKNVPINDNVVGTDVNGDNLTYTKFSNPTNGTVIVNLDGSWRYSPDTDYLGDDAFTVQVSDGHGGTAISTINIKVISPAVNHVPTVPDYYVEIYMNEVASEYVVGLDEDNDILSYYQNSSPSNGVVTVSENGRWIYTPNNDYIGDDSFTILVDDGRGGTAVSTLMIKILEGENKITLTANPSKILGDGLSQSELVAVVTDNDGNPTSGVQVNFTAPRGTFPNGNKAITDSNGVASVCYQSDKITGTEPIITRVTASVADEQRNLYAEDYIDIIFEPAAIRGIVIDNETGLPVEGARVVVSRDFDSDGNIDFTDEYITGSDGEYIIYVPEGNVIYDVNITKPVLIGNNLVDITFKQKSEVDNINGSGGEVFHSTKTAAGVVILKQSDGKEALLDDYSKFTIEIYDDKGNVISNNTAHLDIKTGVFHIENLEAGKDYSLALSMEVCEGSSIIVGKVDVTINDHGEINISKVLIDPYGTVTDLVTLEIIEGAEINLYYANTERNINAGIQPDTLVDLPIVDFPPNDNYNPQCSDTYGQYAYLVYPNTDYYITAKKDGYKDYISGTISVDLEIVKHDFEMEPINMGKIPNPKTGDSINPFMYLLLSVLIPPAVLITRKKYRQKKIN